MTEQKIAIVGSGLIGRAWAIAFARGEIGRASCRERV
jgi:3-hydroxyacyl-CoA dehydrogenase